MILSDRADALRTPSVIVVTLTVVGIAMLIAERRGRQIREADEMSWREALLLGVAQALALDPGCVAVGRDDYDGTVPGPGASICGAVLVPSRRAGDAGGGAHEGKRLLGQPMDALSIQVFIVGIVVSGLVGYAHREVLPALRRRHAVSTCSPGIASPWRAATLAWLPARPALNRHGAVASPRASSPAFSSSCRSSRASRRSSGPSGVIDGFTAPIYARLLGRRVPGLGLLTTAIAVLLVGRGRHQRHRPAAPACAIEHWLLLVPLFRTVYAPVKQLVARVLARQRVRLQAGRPRRGARPRLCDRVSDARVHRRRGQGRTRRSPRSTCRPITSISATSWSIAREQLIFPDLSVEEGVRLFLTGGMALPSANRRAARGLRNVGRGFSPALADLKVRPCSQLCYIIERLPESCTEPRGGSMRRECDQMGARRPDDLG